MHAVGDAHAAGVRLLRLDRFSSLDAWCQALKDEPAWIGAFDFPFGLPRELVVELRWPLQWEALIQHYGGLTRAEIRNAFSAFCAARPVGAKFAHRATDGPSGSSPSMKWVNPPVAFMLHAGVPRLLAAGAALPGLHGPATGSPRVALEGYPGLLARELIGRRSYKSDKAAAQNAARRDARSDLLAALEAGSSRLGLRLFIDDLLREQLIADAKGDCLDAVLCLLQAAWCAARCGSPGPGYGLPGQMDPVEGWIATA